MKPFQAVLTFLGLLVLIGAILWFALVQLDAENAAGKAHCVPACSETSP